jgi:putative ABC transport system permease protein
LKTKIKAISPNTLFSYGFLDERIAGLYSKENNMSEVLKVFAVLAIIISCLGLFGLVAHAAEMRTKEIGIRKVIGCTRGIHYRITVQGSHIARTYRQINCLAACMVWHS